MKFLVIINVLVLMLIINKLKVEKYLKRIISCYLVFSFGIIFISMGNPFDLYEVSNTAYILWIINVNLVSLITILFISFYTKKTENNYEGIIKEIQNSKIIVWTQIILMLLLSYYSIRYSKAASEVSDPSSVRMLFYTNFFSSGIEYWLYNYIVVTTFRCTTIIACILFIEKKIKHPIVIIGIINIILNMTIGYGRMSIYEVALYLIVAYFININRKPLKINLKKIFLVTVIVLLMFCLGIIPTAIRMNIELTDFKKIYEEVIDEQAKQLVIYFTGGFRAFDKFLESGFNGINNFQLGRATFGGIDGLMGMAFSILGKQYITINSMIGRITQENIIIGKDSVFNAFYTCMMNFYLDFGYAGAIIGPVIHSIFLICSYINFKNKKTLVSEILFIYVMMNAFSSIYRWNYQAESTTVTCLVLIGLNIICRRKKDENIMDSKYNFSLSSKTIKNR